MQKYVYMIVTRAGNPLTVDGRLPIYWKRKMAEEIALLHRAKVARIPTPKAALEQGESK